MHAAAPSQFLGSATSSIQALHEHETWAIQHIQFFFFKTLVETPPGGGVQETLTIVTPLKEFSTDTLPVAKEGHF